MVEWAAGIVNGSSQNVVGEDPGFVLGKANINTISHMPSAVAAGFKLSWGWMDLASKVDHAFREME